MCGRLNVTDDPLTKLISEALNVDLKLETNRDLCPSQEVATIVASNGLNQMNTTWGIQPAWSKRLLINAQAETVAEKPTFRQQFASQRCVVPCFGWYEWSSKEGVKRKYEFSHADGRALYMAGLYYLKNDALAQLVTLTATPDVQCRPYHHRMPLLIPESLVNDWLSLPPSQVMSLLIPPNEPLNVRLAA